jgi:hypothetical protein
MACGISFHDAVKIISVATPATINQRSIVMRVWHYHHDVSKNDGKKELPLM